MNERLHPLTLGEVLDRTAQLYRTRFLVYFGIGVIPAGTVLVFASAIFVFLAWVGSDATGEASTFLAKEISWLFLGAVLLLAVPVCLGATAVGWAAMSHAAARSFLGGTIGIRDAYKAAWQRVWRYIWLYLLVALGVLAAPIAVFAVAAPAADRLIALGTRFGVGAASALTGVAVFLLLGVLGVYALWMLLRLCLAFPASVVEEMSAWHALKRGSALSEGTKLRILMLFLLGFALSWLLAFGFTIPVVILLSLFPAANNPQHAQMLGTILMFTWYALWFAVQALTKPVYGIALTLLYFDQRIRREGFDIEWMMQQAGMSTGPQEAGALLRPAFATERHEAQSFGKPANPTFPQALEPRFPGVRQT